MPRWLSVARYAFALLRDFMRGELNLRATSLVYTTMVAIVPLLALSFSAMRALGLHRSLEPLIMSFLAPIGPRAGELTERIMQSIDNVHGSTLASVSVVAVDRERAVDGPESRDQLQLRLARRSPAQLLRRFSEYLGIIVIGPALMSIAIGFTASLRSDAMMDRVAQLGPARALRSWPRAALTPYLLVIATFILLYVYVPNTRVRLKPAVLAGVLAGAAWAAMGGLFTSFVVNVTRNEAIYSGFAIVLAAMIWLQLSWLILLLGAQLAFYVQNPAYLRPGQPPQPDAELASIDRRA